MEAKATFEWLHSCFGSEAWFWSATENNSNNAWTRGLSCDGTGVGRIHYNDSYSKARAYSVRCVRDKLKTGVFILLKYENS